MDSQPFRPFGTSPLDFESPWDTDGISRYFDEPDWEDTDPMDDLQPFDPENISKILALVPVEDSGPPWVINGAISGTITEELWDLEVYTLAQKPDDLPAPYTHLLVAADSADMAAGIYSFYLAVVED